MMMKIYSFLLPYVEKIHATEIDQNFEGDAFFPKLNPEEWKEVSREKGIKDEQNTFDYDFVEYERIKK